MSKEVSDRAWVLTLYHPSPRSTTRERSKSTQSWKNLTVTHNLEWNKPRDSAGSLDKRSWQTPRNRSHLHSNLGSQLWEKGSIVSAILSMVNWGRPLRRSLFYTFCNLTYTWSFLVFIIENQQKNNLCLAGSSY